MHQEVMVTMTNSSGGVDGPEMMVILVEVETAGEVMMTEVMVAMVMAAG